MYLNPMLKQAIAVAKKQGFDYVTQLRDGSLMMTPHRVVSLEVIERTAYEAMMKEAAAFNKDRLLRARRLSSVVYFIASQCLVKIGYATNLNERFSKIQMLSPAPLRLLGVMPGSMADEEALHERFAAQRTKGEWFWINDEIDAFIKEVSVL